jgi:hypothetical protein
MLGEKQSHQKENISLKKYRTKRKLHERDYLMTLDNEPRSYSLVNTKIKVEKQKYTDHLDFIMQTHDPQSRQSWESIATTTDSSFRNDKAVDMNYERDMVEKHYSHQNSYLNRMMFGKSVEL